MKTASFKTAFGLIFCICLVSSAFAQKQSIDPRTNIPISFVGGSDVFPDSWNESPINGRYEDLDSSETARSLKMVLKALEKYPKEVLTNNLREIYVLKSIEFFGQGYGGTNSSDVVYVTNDGVENGYTDQYIEQVFHAEFSSILLRNFPRYFEKGQWVACNGSSIHYGTSGVDALRTGKTGQEFDDQLNEGGILNEYGMSDIENDFNAFAKYMFSPEDGYWARVEKYSAIRKKTKLFVAFYNNLSTTFTEDYFRAFAND